MAGPDQSQKPSKPSQEADTPVRPEQAAKFQNKTSHELKLPAVPQGRNADSLGLQFPQHPKQTTDTSREAGQVVESSLSKQGQQAREYILSHPQEAILLLATVAEHSDQCSALKAELPRMLDILSKEGNDVTVKVLDYPNTAAAKADFGSGATTYPYSVLIAANDRADTSNDSATQRGPICEGLGGFRQAVKGLPVDYINALRGLSLT